MQMRLMFDTVVFNRILDGQLNMGSLRAGVTIYATHVQLDELSNTRDTARRTALTNVFQGTIDAKTATSSFVLGVSRLDEAALGNAEDDLYSSIKGELDRLNKSKPNNVQDALIAETAIRQSFVLVTDDSHLSTVTEQHGGRCLSVAELQAQTGLLAAP